MGAAADAGGDGGERRRPSCTRHGAGKARAGDAFEDPRLARQISPLACMAASRAVTPEPVGERSTSASAKTQTFLVGPFANRRRHRSGWCRRERRDPGGRDATAETSAFSFSVSAVAASTKSRTRLFAERQPELPAVGERIESAAIGDVEAHRPADRQLDRLVAGKQKGRHAFERHARRPCPPSPRPLPRRGRRGIRC